MRHAPTMQNLLIAILLAAHAGIAYAAEGPFFPIDLGTLGGTESYAVAVNDSGQIVGFAYAYLPAIPASWNCKPVQVTPGVWICAHAFSWTPTGGMVDLGTLGGAAPDGSPALSNAHAVNASGQVVGTSFTGIPGQLHAFSWTPAGGMVDLGTLGGKWSFPLALNASGQVVGYSTTPGDVQTHAVLWQSIAKLGCKATLAECNLKGVNIAGAYLPGANLSGSNLKGANLTNANLAGANLKGANVKDVIWSNTICPDGTNSDANGATCVKHL